MGIQLIIQPFMMLAVIIAFSSILLACFILISFAVKKMKKIGDDFETFIEVIALGVSVIVLLVINFGVASVWFYVSFNGLP